MAASFYINSVHVDFDSVLAMSEPGMVSMFQALVESGLQGFLGCTAVVYEEVLVEFFANGAVRDGLVVSSVNGVSVEISEKLFAETFDLPVVGLADVSEMPKDKIFDARSIVSMTRDPVILSGSKSQMKMHYRLLCDIMAKSISVKAGSNALTVEKFYLLTVVVCNVRMNWGSVLFGILKKMVTPGSKQAKGFAIQLSLLLESFPNLGLGESSEFPSSKILTEKTTHRYITIIDKSGAQESADAPKVKKAPTKKVASKKRPADISFDVPVLKKKRTSKRISTLEMVAVAQEAEPIHMIETSTVAPAVEIPRMVISNEVHRHRQYDDTLPTVSDFFRLMRKRWADVCLEVVEFFASRRLLPIGSLQFCRSSSVVEPVFQVALDSLKFLHSEYLSFAPYSLISVYLIGFQVQIFQIFLSSIALDRTALRSVHGSFAQSVVPSVQVSLDQRPSSPTTADSSSSLHFDTTDVDATASSLPPVSQDFSAALADLQAILSEQINESQSGISSKLHKIEQVLRDSLSDQAAIFKNLSQEARQEGRSIDDVQTIHFNEFRKNILAQNASIFVGLEDVRKEEERQEGRSIYDVQTIRFNEFLKNILVQNAFIFVGLADVRKEAQENQNILHAQLSELVDYIHRGSADKKGESGSRGLQQPSNVQVSASAERTPTFTQRVEMAQRHIVHTVLDADANRALLERQAVAERDRQRRRREARMLKRRRRD
ncbi:hypothetical protein F511_40219 [Dorcoceras hygrometricum]|uniref:Dystroglycan-like n=1 Tax=Dorcoceras hygrometricum TaxID=472368 RepID=A0A2Z7A8H5_9LAMI|nr:hypothetical protein F511_40219 [Dorcoceras hygrometricum]